VRADRIVFLSFSLTLASHMLLGRVLMVSPRNQDPPAEAKLWSTTELPLGSALPPALQKFGPKVVVAVYSECPSCSFEPSKDMRMYLSDDDLVHVVYVDDLPSFKALSPIPKRIVGVQAETMRFLAPKNNPHVYGFDGKKGLVFRQESETSYDDIKRKLKLTGF
jgi:hypothetical protein